MPARSNPDKDDPVVFNVRLSKSLHAQLRDLAAEEGVSMQTLCQQLLAGGIGFKLDNEAAKGPLVA
jgi:predicted HicB family RNase H-like nuclease